MEQDNNIRVHNATGSGGHSVSDFIPLIGILGVVLILTAISVLMFSQDWMLSFMGWFFIVFGTLKTIRIRSFAAAYKMYDIVAMRSTVYAFAYPLLELGFGFAYLFQWQVQTVSIVVVVVMLVGAFGVYKKLKEKEEIPCACLGTVFKVPMTWVTLGEDLLMAGMALMLVV